MDTSLLLIFNKIGATELLLIIGVVLLLFGGRKIPELMRGIGRGVKEFKEAISKDYSSENNQDDSKPEDKK